MIVDNYYTYLNLILHFAHFVKAGFEFRWCVPPNGVGATLYQISVYIKRFLKLLSAKTDFTKTQDNDRA